MAALGNGNALAGGLGAAANQALIPAMQHYLRNHDIDPNSAHGRSLMQLGSAAVGGGAGAASALDGEQFNRQLHPDEIGWIKSNAKDFAAQQCGCDPSNAQIDAATAQLSQQATRQTDVLWAATMPGNDPAAQQYLAGTTATFTNELGNAQQLFTTVGNQYLQPTMYLPDAAANRAFYQQYVQPGVSQSAGTGLDHMLSAAGQYALEHPGSTLWNVGAGAVTGIGEAILHPIDTFNGAGQGLGENAAYALNAGLMNAQLASVYGQDVSTAAASLTAANSALTLLAVTGVGKTAGAVIDRTAQSAAMTAVKQAVGSAWKGDAAGLDQFAQSVTGNVGAINRFLSADAVNATMDTYNWAPAWQSGTQVADATLKPGTVVNMVVDAETYDRIKANNFDRAFGGWATFDNVPNQAYARNELAITSQMKPDAGYVIQVEVTKPINAQIGIVGEQPGATGGGNQLHFNLPPDQRASIFRYIPNSGRGLR